jgi:8-amino-7-oxononanoate synthase
MPALAEVAREKLQALDAQGRRRVLKSSQREEGVMVVRGGKRLISFSCNDYLGLAQHAQVKAAAIGVTEKYGTGAGASRLITGNHPLYAELETKIAAWKGTERALVFGSGYLTNTGVIPAFMGKGDLILADKLVHACLIDGAMLSGAKLVRFKHNDVEDCRRLLEAQRKKHPHCLIVTDEVFSMDGDLAPLAELAALARAHGAWVMADGAHSFAGKHVAVDIYTGTLSKALGSYGGYVAASREVIDYLATQARSFMFSTGLPPAVVAAALAALDLLTGNPALAGMPLARARLFTSLLGLPPAQSAIVPLLLGEESRALAAAAKLEEAGYLVAAIRPPTVPPGTSRLRFAFSALHTQEDVQKLAGMIKKEGWV